MHLSEHPDEAPAIVQRERILDIAECWGPGCLEAEMGREDGEAFVDPIRPTDHRSVGQRTHWTAFWAWYCFWNILVEYTPVDHTRRWSILEEKLQGTSYAMP